MIPFENIAIIVEIRRKRARILFSPKISSESDD